MPLAVLATAPLRPPIAFESGGGFPLALAEDGQLGRLLPLYFVLAAAGLALAWRAGRGAPGAARALPRAVGLPAAAFIAFACVSLTWADELESGAELLLFFTVPFARARGRGRPGAVPGLGAARARADRDRPGGGLRGGGPVPGRHPRALLLRPQPGRVQRQLGLLPGHVAVRRPQPLRAARGAGPRVGAGGAGAAPGRPAPGHRPCWCCCGRGLFVSYSQSSMVGPGRRDPVRGGGHRRPPGAAGRGGRPGGRVPDRGRLPGRHRAPGRLAEARDQRPHPAGGGHPARGEEAPVVGVGIGGQPLASRRLLAAATGRRRTSCRTPRR